MMFCNSCGKNNKDSARFCRACGVALTDDQLPSPHEAVGASYTAPDVSVEDLSATRLSSTGGGQAPDPWVQPVPPTYAESVRAGAFLLAANSQCPACAAPQTAGNRWCTLCQSHMMDPSVGKLAPPLKRLLATILDMVIPFALLMFVILSLFSGGVGAAADRGASGMLLAALEGLLVLAFLVTYVVCAVLLFASGTTPGKRLLGMYVVTQNGASPGFVVMLIRETIGRWISSLFFSLGNLWILLDKERQAWHDKLASSYVVERRQPNVLTQRYARAPLYPAALLIMCILLGVPIGRSRSNYGIARSSFGGGSLAGVASGTASASSAGNAVSASESGVNGVTTVDPQVTSWAGYTQGSELSFDYPASWQTDVKRAGASGRTQFSSPSPEIAIAVDVDRQKDRDPMVDGRYWDAYFRKRNPSGYQLVSLDYANIAGHSAARWVFSQQASGRTTDEVLFHRGGKLFSLLFRAPSTQFEAWKPAWQHVLDSCRFVN